MIEVADEMFGTNGPARVDSSRTDDILKLTHVTGPRVGQQRDLGIAADLLTRKRAPQDVTRQEHAVAPPLSQWRKADHVARDPVKQIRSELPLLHHRP